jgi:PKD repeat protein
MNTFNNISLEDIARIFRAVCFVEKLERSGFNHNSVAGFKQAIRRPMAIDAGIVEVAGEKISYPSTPGSRPEDDGLYPGTMYLPDATATPPWKTTACYLRGVPGHPLEVEDIGIGKLVGVRNKNEDGDPDRVPVYGFAPGLHTQDIFGPLPGNGFTTITIEGNTYVSTYIGCGLVYNEDGAIVVYNADLVGDAAVTSLVIADDCGIAFDKTVTEIVPITYVTDVEINYPAPGSFQLRKTSQTIADHYNAAGVHVNREYSVPVVDTYTVNVCDLIECCEYDPLDVSYGADPIYGDAELEVDFTVTVTGGSSDYSYFWDFDDGATSTAQNPTHTFTDPGVYEVTITVTDNVCGMEETYTIYIYVSEPCACAVCEEEGFPLRYTFTLSGATSDFAGVNGAWIVYHTVDCSWFGFNDNGWSVSLVINNDQTRDIVFVGPDLQSITYETDAAGCCSTIAPGNITFVDAVGTGDEAVFDTPGIVPLDGCYPCGTIETECCEELLPEVLNANFNDGSNNDNVTLTWNVTRQAWEGTWNSCCVQLACTLGNFTLTIKDSACADLGMLCIGSFSDDTTVCDPFSFEVDIDFLNCCAGAYSVPVHVTITPA